MVPMSPNAATAGHDMARQTATDMRNKVTLDWIILLVCLLLCQFGKKIMTDLVVAGDAGNEMYCCLLTTESLRTKVGGSLDNEY